MCTLEVGISSALINWLSIDAGGRAGQCLPGSLVGREPATDQAFFVPTNPLASMAAIEFALEQPRGALLDLGKITESREIFVSGWCFSTNDQPVELTFRIGDEETRRVVPTGFRPDVARAHAGVARAATSGFGLLAPLPRTPGSAVFRVDARVEGEIRLLAEFEIDVPSVIEVAEGLPTPMRRRHRARGERRRILFVTHRLNLEGAPRSLLETALAMDPRRYEKRLSSPVDGPLGDAWRDAGVAVERLTPDLSIAGRDDFDAQIRRLAAMVSVWRPDVLIANTLEAYWAIHVAVELRRPSIWTVRESEPPDVYFYSRWPTAIADRARAALDLADRVVFVAEATRSLFLEHLPESRDRLIPNGLDFTRFDLRSSQAQRARIRRRLGLNERTPLLLCVGTPCPRKGQLELIQALNVLRSSRPDFHCVFLGTVENEYLDTMRKELTYHDLADHVTLASPVPDARPHFAAADVVVCPSYQESLPRVVLEAMAFAKPIVASKVFGIPELVRDEVEGLLVEAGDVQALAKVIDRLLADSALARQLGEKARERAETHFSLSRCAHRYEELVEELLSGPVGG